VRSGRLAFPFTRSPGKASWAARPGTRGGASFAFPRPTGSAVLGALLALQSEGLVARTAAELRCVVGLNRDRGDPPSTLPSARLATIAK
jgi:hypothetical protein